jgi:hypothetical protein
VHKLKQRKFVVLAVLVVGAIAAVGGYAFWTQGGTGTGSAATGTTASITVNQTSVVSGLSPGGSAQALSGNFDNPNAGPVLVTDVSANVTGTSAGASCDASNFAITGSPTAVGTSIPSGLGVGSWSGMTVAMLETGVNQDACKNVTVDISYTAS